MPQDTFFQSQSEAQPKLNPPIYRWQEDMPDNNQPQLVPPQLIWLNTKNSIWMEIPRYEAIMWGGMIFGGVITLAATLFMLVISFFVIDDIVDNLGFGVSGTSLIMLFFLSISAFSQWLSCFLKFIFLNLEINPFV